MAQMAALIIGVLMTLVSMDVMPSILAVLVGFTFYTIVWAVMTIILDQFFQGVAAGRKTWHYIDTKLGKGKEK